jgi:rsbT co-antagonist protein RsbR
MTTQDMTDAPATDDGADGSLIGQAIILRDATEQIRNEQERAALHEQVIAAQQAALRELSTPIIPLTDDVVAMPLIGAIDSNRAQQVIETLLAGVSNSRATTAILDITGVQIVDTQVANALLRAAQAVKLLGAQVVLTGIRPEIAQTLVGLGLDLSGIVTRATLQSGIAFALAGRAIGGSHIGKGHAS